jgi:hypothetical protein
MWEEDYNEFVRELGIMTSDVEHMVLDTSANEARYDIQMREWTKQKADFVKLLEKIKILVAINVFVMIGIFIIMICKYIDVLDVRVFRKLINDDTGIILCHNFVTLIINVPVVFILLINIASLLQMSTYILHNFSIYKQYKAYLYTSQFQKSTYIHQHVQTI